MNPEIERTLVLRLQKVAERQSRKAARANSTLAYVILDKRTAELKLQDERARVQQLESELRIAEARLSQRQYVPVEDTITVRAKLEAVKAKLQGRLTSSLSDTEWAMAAAVDAATHLADRHEKLVAALRGHISEERGALTNLRKQV